MKPLINTTQSKTTDTNIMILDDKISIPKKYLLEKAHLEDDSIFIVSGSLIEGIGTIQSDIDCIVVCEKRPTASEISSKNHALVTDTNYHYITGDEDVHNTTNFFGETSIHIDVDYITFEELEKTMRKIERTYDEITKDQRVIYEPILSNTENNIIHRSLTGHALNNEKTFNRVKAKIPIDKHIYLAHREKLPVFYAFQDVQGCWQSGNLWMGCEIARDMLLKTTMSFTYLTGTTNKHYKWVYSNMLRVCEYEDIKNMFFLLARKGATSEPECRTYILQALEYIDLVFYAMEDILKKTKTFPLKNASLAALDKEFSNRHQTNHRLSKCEYHFRKKYFAATDTPPLTTLLKEWD